MDILAPICAFHVPDFDYQDICPICAPCVPDLNNQDKFFLSMFRKTVALFP